MKAFDGIDFKGIVALPENFDEKFVQCARECVNQVSDNIKVMTGFTILLVGEKDDPNTSIVQMGWSVVPCIEADGKEADGLHQLAHRLEHLDACIQTLQDRRKEMVQEAALLALPTDGPSQ